MVLPVETGPTESAAVKPRGVCRILDCGLTHAYKLINSGELDSFLDGRSRKVTVNSIHAYIFRCLKLSGGSKKTRIVGRSRIVDCARPILSRDRRDERPQNRYATPC